MSFSRRSQATSEVRQRLVAGALVLVVATLTSAAGISSPAHADSIRDKQWHLEYLKASQLHKITKGKGVTVGVIDTGVDASHPDLTGNVLEGKDFNKTGDGRTDKTGHGTAMASLIAGHGHGPRGRNGVLGIAPEASVLPGRIEFGQGDKTDTDKALDWAVDQGAEVINLSLRGSGGLSHIQNALENDVIVVAGVGNTVDGDPDVAVPAAYEGVIAVSGVDRSGNFHDGSARGPEVVLAAPMEDIMAGGTGERGRYGTASGTSNAAAIVSGVAALIKAKYPDISANGVINRLIETADDKGPPGRDDKYGFGVINPLKALTADIPDIHYNPLIEGEAPSASPSATTPPAAKADNDKTGAVNYLLPALAGTAALIVMAGLGTYFFTLTRRARRNLLPDHSRARFPAQQDSHPNRGSLPPAGQSYLQRPSDPPSGPHTGTARAGEARPPQRE